MTPSGISVVVPTLGRPSLAALLTALAADGPPPVPVEVLLIDDRRDHRHPLSLPPVDGIAVKVVTGRAAGPAAARNTGWRVARHEWVAFLDDDVLPDPDWLAALTADLAAADPRQAGVQGRLRVPLPPHRRPTDWERVTAGLADGEWITADMAYRREALAAVGGFEERLPRAFREDAELAYRMRRAGWQLIKGARTVTHPVRPVSRWVSVRTQAGNADDALLRRLYGPRWRDELQLPPGRRHRHAGLVASGLTAVGCATVALMLRRRAPADCAPTARAPADCAPADRAPTARGRGGVAQRAWWLGAACGAVVWAGGTVEFAVARIAPGPRGATEVATMLASSVVIPPVAVTHWLRGWWRWRRMPAPAGRR